MLEIRRAQESDRDFIVRSNLAMAEETEQLQLDAETLRLGVQAILRGEHAGAYWVATRDNTPVGQLMVTFEWSDWRNRIVWWIQSVYVVPDARRHGVFRALYLHTRRVSEEAGAAGLRLYVDATNTSAQSVYRALGMNGDHYRVFEDMFAAAPHHE